MDVEQFSALMGYVGFDEADLGRLRDFYPLAAPYFGDIVEDFYRVIRLHPEAKKSISGGEEQARRLQQTLRGWLRTLLESERDEGYLQARARIGRVHVRINLPQQFMFTAMSRVRDGLLRIVDSHPGGDCRQREALSGALNRALDLELALMLETYKQDWMTRVEANGRLAAIGQIAASIGHELRNPLAIMDSSLFLLQQRIASLKVEDDVLGKHHGRIREQVESCSNTISALLDLARDAPLRRERLKAVELIEKALAELRGAQKSSLVVAVHCSVELSVYADPHQLRQVLLNLLANANEATGGTASIEVTAEQTPRGVAITVEDDGPGVPSELQERIFEPLFTTRAKGTGLGLALCRRIVQAHEGELTLEPSERGARFVVFLPTVLTTEPVPLLGEG